MKNLLYKELKLVLSGPLYLFTALTLLMFIPSFPPISNMAYSLIGLITVLNVAMGERDFEFMGLLPIPRHYVVLSKVFALVYAEILQLLVAIPCALLLVKGYAPLGTFKGMNTNLFFFAVVFFNYGIFNLIFLPWFFRTAEKVNKPLLTGLLSFFALSLVYGIIVYMCPGLNAIGGEGRMFRVLLLVISIILYILLTFIAYKKAVKNYRKVSL